MELVVTVAIIGTLASIAIPSFIEFQVEAKATMSQTNMIQIKQAFANHFFNSVLDRETKEYPPEPPDNLLTKSWADNTVLYNGRTVSELFSEKEIPYNPYGNPYYYELLPKTDIEEEGFLLKDLDFGLELEFRP